MKISICPNLNLFTYFPTYWKMYRWAQLWDTAWRNITFFYMINTCDIGIKPIFCLVLTNKFGQFLAIWLHFQSEIRSHKLLSRITSIFISLWYRGLIPTCHCWKKFWLMFYWKYTFFHVWLNGGLFPQLKIGLCCLVGFLLDNVLTLSPLCYLLYIFTMVLSFLSSLPHVLSQFIQTVLYPSPPLAQAYPMGGQ